MKSHEERLAWALNICEKSHLRMTPVRSSVLGFLAEQRIPASLDRIYEDKAVANQYDTTTVYRTLMVFKDAGVVRCAGPLRKTSHFVLAMPDEGSQFLVCERCGTVIEIELPPNTKTAIQRVAVEHGFAASGQCMELLGLCRRCDEQARKGIGTSKHVARSLCI